jgi:hypothetical protein
VGSPKLEVFIASRFDEFGDLRERLVQRLAKTRCMAPVDLNDGRARHAPPLAECLSRVQRADLLVLLLGESYGPPAPRKTKSFTHLEYEEAAREGSKTRVLAYRVRRAAAAGAGGTPVPEAWLAELEEAHTLAPLDGTKEPDVLVSEIMEQVTLALFELYLGEVSEEGDAADDDPEPPDDTFDDSEVESLEAAEAGARGIAASVTEAAAAGKPDFALSHPAATASLEQRSEAERAILLREFGIAILHLKKALELRPLDGLANFWLARLYLALGRHARYGQAANLAERAANIASEARLPYRAAAAHLLAARIFTELEDTRAAHDSVNRALEQKPDFAKAHLERARIFCREGARTEGVSAVRQAFQHHSRSLYLALRDPHLRPIRRELRELLRAETAHWIDDVERLLGNERILAGLAGEDVPEIDVDTEAASGLTRLRQLGQQSILRQHELVKRLVTTADGARRDSTPEVRSSTAAELTATRQRLERELVQARDEERKAGEEVAQARKLPALVGASVLLPIGLGPLLGYFQPWKPVGFVVLFGCTLWALHNLLQSRSRRAQALARLKAAEDRHETATATRARREREHAGTEAQWSALRSHYDQVRAVAEKALATFEERSLAMPARYQPFDSLRRAQKGKVVRVSPQAVERFEQHYERSVERDEEFWLEAERPSGFALYQVTAAERRRVRLSRAEAYSAA